MPRIPFWVVASACALGCLDDPPTFAPRGQIPPFILAGQVEPPIGAIYEGPPTFQIDVPFRSEDVNIALEARIYRDLVPGTSSNNGLERWAVPPGNFEELRQVSIDWTEPERGCHSLTVILTYEDNFGLNGLPLDDTLAARVVWWLNINDINGSVRMSSCLGASQLDTVQGRR